MVNKIFRVLSFLLASAIVFPVILSAQSLGNAGTVTGTVTDPSGAALPNATVAIRKPVTGYTQSVTTRSSGSFRL